MNFAGKEKMAEDYLNGKNFSYTFRRSESIIFDVKENQNAITTSEVKIRVREENFKDYKKSLMGK